MHLSAVDANLLSPLHALLEEQNVVRAAKRIGLSPSATSHALARLRELLADPLLARAGRRLVRTARGEALLEDVRRAVAEVERVFRGPAPLDLAKLRRAFRIATTDHVQLVLLTRADRALARTAPLVDLFALPLPRATFEDLRTRETDLVVSVIDEVPSDLARAPLFRDRLVTVVRKGHPLLRGRVTLKRFAEPPHVLVAPTGNPVGLVDGVLAKEGVRRRVARTLPTFVDAAFLVAESDYVTSLPASLVAPLRKRLPLEPVRVPIDLPRFTLSLIWHRRDDADPAHTFIRETLRNAGTEVEATVRESEKKPQR